MAEVKMKKPAKLKSTCCEFAKWIEIETLKTELEKDLVDFIWIILEQNKRVCKNCLENVNKII